ISNTSSLPENARSMSLSMIREGLRPRSLTRDNKWGIPSPFPGSEGKTIYVWMEAVLGYISATKEYFEKIGRPDEFNRFWRDKDTKSVYFIGKDNIPFHVVILPALIMASKEG
ncbi:MAG: class I tRNA ligase family protein, partial [Candidatus Methanodesulfokora sp.]